MRGFGAGPGFSLPEVLVAVLLTALLGQMTWSVFSAQRSLWSGMNEQEEMLESWRIVRTVVGFDLRAGVPGRDWESSGDSIPLRAFRGWAIVCDVPDPTTVLVVYEGIRQPDPSKDSLLFVDESGRWTAVRLSSRSPDDTCSAVAGMVGERWIVEGATPFTALLVRYYERGVYSLSGGALRYRRGAGGRQPLTPVRFITPPSQIVPWREGGVLLRVGQPHGRHQDVRVWEQAVWAKERTP